MGSELRQIGRYEVGDVLGEGGAGRVYRAILRGPVEREVALKVMSGAQGGLEREARLGGLLRHVNLVDVYEVGRVHETWFCAMELCGGGALSEYVPLPPRAVVEVGLQVCDALGYAHRELGLVHQDLKPHNLLLDGATVKVADLGIASAQGFSGDGRIRGTPGYMAPEQARGGPVDARTDVFALGVVLQELAVGLRGHASETFSLEGEVEQLTGLRAEVGWLAPVLDRCLDTDPDSRFADMAELAVALRAIDVEGAGLAEFLGVEEEPVPDSGLTRTNLGAEPDRFVGRERERARLHELLEPGAIVVLKGAGGIGKTRLAAAVAREEHTRTGEQAWMCDLSQVRDRAAVVQALAATLGVRLASGPVEARVDGVAAALAGRGSPIVVLDNFEQVKAHSDLVRRLVQGAPKARVIVTSREVVDLPTILELEPLDTGSARELLVERAKFRGVDLDGDPAVDELAERLEGVPLALELAAGRLGVLSPTEMVDRLELPMLRSGRRDVADRQATLEATLAWSWDLLSEAERVALAQMSVFHGGFTLAAAEAVVDCGIPAIEAIDGLVSRSMLHTREGRLQMLESVRAFAEERLESPDPVRLRHAEWYGRYGRHASIEALHRHGGTPLRTALVAEHDNLVAAAREALARRDVARGLRAVLALWEVLELQGSFEVCIELSEALLRVPGATAAEVGWLHSILARSLRHHGRPDDGVTHAEEAVRIGRETRDAQLEVRGTITLAVLEIGYGRIAESDRLLARAMDQARERGLEGLESVAMTNAAHVRKVLGKIEESHALGLRALELHRRLGNLRAEGVVLGNLSLLHRSLGEVDAALETANRAIAIHRETGDRRMEALVLGGLGALHLDTGDYRAAVESMRTAVAIHREHGSRVHQADALCTLGDVFLTLGDLDQAEAIWNESLELHRALHQPVWIAIVLGNLALLDVFRGDVEAARVRLGQALAVPDADTDPLWAAFSLALRAELEMAQDRFDVAEPILERAEAALAPIAAQAPARVSGLLAEARAERDFEGAAAVFERALQLATERRLPREVATIRTSWARALARRGELELASAQLDLAREIIDGLGLLPTAPPVLGLRRAEALLGGTDGARGGQDR